LADTQGLGPDLGKRIRMLRVAARDPGPCFNAAATALVQRKRLNIHYEALSTGEFSHRDVSPQRLIHYRDNWFLDAWCHLRNELRIFSVDCILEARQLNVAADEIADEVMDLELGSSYGLFAGQPTAIACLKFSPRRARWVHREQWHPQQKGRFLDTGEYLLEIPFHRSEELILDIMKYGSEVVVLEPVALRQEVVKRLREALEKYS
jgi:predicted DNA-binding transcriptional regulator YafY